MKTALIVSVGGSPEPIIKTIQNLKPNLTYFLASQESVTQIGQITEKSGLTSGRFKTEILENHQDMRNSFESALTIIQYLKKSSYRKIYVDYTGGTKSMSVGLVLATIREGCEFVYVGGKKRTKHGLGIVKKGSEMMIAQKNPYDVFAIFETEKAMLLFNDYQFDASLHHFENALKKIQDENRKLEIQILIRLVKVYSKWDKFHVDGEIIGELGKCLGELGKLSKISKRSYDFVEQLKANYEFLRRRDSNYEYLIADILANALRRMEEGKYDDAVARFYRVVELLAQYQLEEYGFDPSDLDVRKLPEEVRKKYERLRENVEGKEKIQLGLRRSYELLADLNYKLGKEFV
ncbi:MAG: TIGR02710 family CRISPR-associated CARF protein, partial [Candidatus Syntropharchaeia archaeon]